MATPFFTEMPRMSGPRLPLAAPALLAGALAIGAMAAHRPAPMAPTVAVDDKVSIPELAVSSGRLDTLVAAVKFAGLADALSGDGPFTVFAPTDEAFARIDDDTLASLLTERGRPTLQRILKHHVVAGDFKAADLVGRDSIQTLAGTTLELDAIRGRLLVADSVVETANVDARNGVVHLIDRVMLPPREIAPLEVLLENTVNRGAPIFNDGDPGACAAIYATALDAVALGSGFGLDERMRNDLSGKLAKIEKDIASDNGRDRAWAYRAIIDELFTSIQNGTLMDDSTSTAAADGRDSIMRSGKTIFDFEDRSQFQGWRTVLDGVMGGRSTGRIMDGNGTLVFDGATSLENNGGFSSIRCDIPDGMFDGADAVRLVVKGDGRDYKFSVKSSRGRGAGGYWASFPTTKDEWTEVVIPIDSLDRQFMGQRLQGRVNPDDIRAVEFYIYDKNAGPFRLEVDSISAVGSGTEA